MSQCLSRNPHDPLMRCAATDGHDGQHRMGGIAWGERDPDQIAADLRRAADRMTQQLTNPYGLLREAADALEDLASRAENGQSRSAGE